MHIRGPGTTDELARVRRVLVTGMKDLMKESYKTSNQRTANGDDLENPTDWNCRKGKLTVSFRDATTHTIAKEDRRVLFRFARNDSD